MAPSAINLRKGVPAHSQILQSYLRGIEFGEKDVVVWVEVLANRPEVKQCFLNMMKVANELLTSRVSRFGALVV